MGKKLPRRTMSIAKRGVNTAEAAADLDLVEGAIGNPETDGPDGEGRFTTMQLLLGFALAVVFTFGLLFVAQTMFEGPDTNYSMLPDGYREATGLSPGVDIQPPPSVVLADDDDDGSRSPFPDAQTRDPVILEVDCPDGTVQISTGQRAADTVCIRGQLVDGGPQQSTAPTPLVQHVTIYVNGAPTVTPTVTPTLEVMTTP